MDEQQAMPPGGSGQGAGTANPGAEEGIPLLEGWMLGLLLYPCALEEIRRVPPANDLMPEH